MLVRMLRAPGKRASRRRFSLETRAALFRLSRDEIGRRVAKQGGGSWHVTQEGIEPASADPTKSTPTYTHSSWLLLEAMQLHYRSSINPKPQETAVVACHGAQAVARALRPAPAGL